MTDAPTRLPMTGATTMRAPEADGPIVRLVVTPDPLPVTASNKTASFIARLESTGDFVVNSHRPLVDGARELLARGFDPATPLTMRHADKAHDSFQPMPIGHWAKVSYTESEKGDLRLRPWMPFAGATSGQKSGSEPSGGETTIEKSNRFHAVTQPAGGPSGNRPEPGEPS